jgi:hypothetical protein
VTRRFVLSCLVVLLAQWLLVHALGHADFTGALAEARRGHVLALVPFVLLAPLRFCALVIVPPLVVARAAMMLVVRLRQRGQDATQAT